MPVCVARGSVGIYHDQTAIAAPTSGRRRLTGLVLAALCLTTSAGCAPDYVDYPYDMSDTAIAHRKAKKIATQTSIPVPEQALLAAPKAPNCETKVEASDAKAPAQQQAPTPVLVTHRASTDQPAPNAEASDAAPPAAPAPVSPPAEAAAAPTEAALATRIKLEYERECYRQAERMRDRLRLLQVSANETIKAVKRSQESTR